MASVTLQVYGRRIEDYQRQWNEYSEKITIYHKERQEADSRYGLQYFSSSEGMQSYLKALHQDAKVKSIWREALQTQFQSD